MKTLKGGEIYCSYTDTSNGLTNSGPCSSSNKNDCFSYVQKAANTYNQQAGYPGISYKCYYV